MPGYTKEIVLVLSSSFSTYSYIVRAIEETRQGSQPGHIASAAFSACIEILPSTFIAFLSSPKPLDINKPNNDIERASSMLTQNLFKEFAGYLACCNSSQENPQEAQISVTLTNIETHPVRSIAEQASLYCV